MSLRAIDLTHPVATGMPVYPGDPEVRIDRALSVAEDGVEVASLALGSHSGTHLDAPSHSIPGGRTVDELPLEWLSGAARVLRASAPPSSEIGPGDLELPDRLPLIVCVATGWDRWFTSEGFASGEARRHPWIAPALAQELWRRGARVLGVDALSPDPTRDQAAGSGTTSPDDAGASEMPVHEFWLGGGGIIVENLARLDLVSDDTEMSLLPLCLAGVDGSPIRAVAWERAVV